MLLFLTESMVIGTVGGLLGLLLGGSGAYYLEVVGINLGEQVTQNMSENIVMSSTVYADLSPEVLVTSFFVGLTMAAVGSIVPAWRASQVEPVVAMRA